MTTTGTNVFHSVPAWTTPAASPGIRPLADRTDLDMKAQRHHAQETKCESMGATLVAEYKGTFCTRKVHRQFLAQILHEIQRFHWTTHGVHIPTQAMETLASHIIAKMKSGSSDHYSDCLNLLRAKRVYDPSFVYEFCL